MKSINTVDDTNVVAVLETIAKETGRVICSHFRYLSSVETKDDNTIVTVADKEAEAVAREIIEKAFPEHAILGEEQGIKQTGSEYQWIIDPIDGTKSFAAGAFDFGTVVGLLHRGVPVYGMINLPHTGDCLIGDGESTYHNGKKLPELKSTTLDDAILCCTDVFGSEQFKSWENFYKLTRKVKFTRTWGNAYGYALLAFGEVDIMIDPIVNTWDIAGLIPVLKGVGCAVTDYAGHDFSLQQTDLIATKPSIYEEVYKTLTQKEKVQSRPAANMPDLQRLLMDAEIDKVDRVVIGAVIVRGDSEVFLMRRAPEEFMPGSWEFPGGGVEAGESMLEAVKREVLEEARLKVEAVNGFLGSFDYPGKGGTKHRQFNFLVRASGGPQLSSEHDDFMWISVEEALAMPAVHDVFKTTLRQL